MIVVTGRRGARNLVVAEDDGKIVRVLGSDAAQCMNGLVDAQRAEQRVDARQFARQGIGGCLLFGGDDPRLAKATLCGDQRCPRDEAAKVSHVVDHALVVEQVLVKLVGDPPRQDDERRCADEVEVNEYPVEEADLAQPVERDEHRHHARDRAGRADAWRHPAGVEDEIKDAGAESGQQVEGEETAFAECLFDGDADDEEDRHVTEQMVEAAMQEHVAEQCLHGWRGGAEAEALDGGRLLPAVERRALALPVRIVFVLRRDDAAGAQLLHERFVGLHGLQEGERLVGVQRFLCRSRILVATFLFEVLDVARELDCRQT